MKIGKKIEGKKLSTEDFGEKYWKGNNENYIYQFITLDIEDGDDELTQLLINNDRALVKLCKEHYRRCADIMVEDYNSVKAIRKKVNIALTLSTSINLLVLTMLLLHWILYV